ncbi:MAG: ABC transporter substrate-binding protein [Candidatus Tectomicrobia bacterium]|nr:ABC transporter substrate-binding protein [Candidatus Tectomicrobia bacterium]
MKTRGALQFFSAGLLFLFFSAAWGAERVSFNLNWVPHGRDIPYFVALEKGYFREEGLQVKLERGYGSADAFKKVAAGTNDLGVTDPASLILGRAQGVGLKMVGVWHDRAPYLIRTLEGSGINRPQDLVGRTLGTPPGDATLQHLPALAEMLGFDLSKVKVVNVDGAVREAALVGGKFDAVTGFVQQYPAVKAMAEKQGKKVKDILLAKYGLDVYALGISAKDEVLSGRAPMVRGFLKAVVRGVAFSIQSPDQATDMFIKHNPTADRTLNRQVWDLALDTILTAAQEKLGLLHMTRDKWVKTRDVLTKALKVKRGAPVEDLYTNDFLPKVLPPKRGPRAFPPVY